MTGERLASVPEPAPTLGRRERFALAAITAALVVGLLATLVPGVFIIDEDHYLVSVLALRAGGLTAPGSENLPPSRALRWFDPWGHRLPAASPAPTTVPPLYAPLALPFSLFGWRGLFALNVLAFAGVALLVFGYARRHSERRSTAWIALSTYVLSGYAIEYAQGMWPHLLATLLTTAAVVLAARTAGRDDPRAAALAGLCGGLAAGVRYQNVVLAGAVGLGVLLFARRRWRAAATFALGLALPLAVTATLNARRIGTPNPITKGIDYLASPIGQTTPRRVLADAATMAWARIVDFSKRPPITDPRATAYIRREDRTGAWLYEGVIKKAWLQSSPWIVLALLAAIPRRRWFTADVGPGAREPARIALVLAAVLGLFAFAEVGRHDGLSYNQRYLIELVPLAAVSFAWALERRRIEPRLLAATGAAGFAICAIWLDIPFTRTLRAELVLRTPLLIAAALGAVWLWAKGNGANARRACAVAAGLALGWALAIHLIDDLDASRARRTMQLELAHAYARDLPPAPARSAVLVYWGAKDPIGPLLFERDLVVADVHNDEGRTMPALIDAWFAEGRRVFVSKRMPPELLERQVGARYRWRPDSSAAELHEIFPGAAAGGG